MKYYLIYDKDGKIIDNSRLHQHCEEFDCRECTETDFMAFEEVKNNRKLMRDLRDRREAECFCIINRGRLWYETLSEQQLAELDAWYKEWLDVTETHIIPKKPTWIK